MIRILFVCTGNICRSPMAEGMLRVELERRGCRDVEVASAGTWAVAENPATSEAVAAASGRRIDISSHRARSVTVAEIEDADLVLVMTGVHEREVVDLAPQAAGKTFLVRELAEMEVPPGSSGSGADRLGAFLGSLRPERKAAHEVRDPYGLPFSAYERALSDIEEGILRLADVLCGEPESPSRRRPSH